MNKNYRINGKSKASLKVAVLKKTVSKSKKKRSFKRLNSLTAKVAHTASFALIAFLSGHALAADCKNLNNVPVSTPTLGDDITLCRSGTLINWNDLGGDDQLQLGNITGDFILDGSIQMGSGSDQLHLTKYQDTGFELITTNSSSIDMGTGNDYLWLYSYPTMSWTFNTATNLGSGNDWLLISDDVIVEATIHGGDGNDQLGFGASAQYDGEGASQGASAPTINADVFGDAGDDTFWISKGAIVNGTLDGGSGNDFFMLRKGSAKQVNGNTGNDVFILEGTFNHADPNLILDGGADEDTIDFQTVVGSVKAENIRNFEKLRLLNSTKLNLTGSQLTIASAQQDALVNISSGSQLSFSSTIFTIAGGQGISNSGTLNLRGTAPGKTLFLNGSYTGDAGSQILFNTKLGNDNSLTDRMVVTGSTSGESKVFVNNIGGTGAKTVDGINLIEVQGSSDAVFTLGAPVQVGSWEYFLFKKGKNWNLESSGGGDGNQITPVPTPTPTPTPSPSPSPSATPSPTPVPTPTSPKIYRPAVAGYLQAAQAQFDQNANLVGTLEQRQASINNTGDIWGRVIADKSSKKTSTFGYEQSSQTLQFGKDIIDTKSGAGNQTKAGVTVGLGQQSSSYSDQIRAFTSTGINTGASDTTEFALGAYYTQRNEVNPYMDLQAHIIGSRTEFNDVYDGSAKQTGLGVALSAELGKDIALGNTGLDITPQAQAVYQNHSYSGFNDATSDVAKQNAESLRVRAGVTLKSSKAKLAANDSKTSWSASVNVLQEVLDNPSRTVAGNVVSADNQQKPWLEVGVGLNHQLNEASSLTAQISHKRSISGSQQSGNAVNVAYRLKW